MKTRTVPAAAKRRVQSAIAWVRSSRRRIVAAAVIPLCVIALSLALSQKRSYSLNPSITHSVYTIPKDAVWYLEVLEPQQLYSIFEQSRFGRSLIESKAWEKLAGTPEFHTISNLLYFIELKAGIHISYTEVPSFLGGSAGMAKMKDGSLLIVARTNLKSRFTISLLSAFKGDKAPLARKKAPEGDGKKREGVSADSYKELFDEENVPFANLSVTKIHTQSGAMYLVMLDDYLFVSDSEDTLKESLYLATQNDPSSVKKISGMSEAVTAFENGGHVLLYLDGTKSSVSPLLGAFVKGGSGAAIVLYPDKTKPLTGDIFAAGDFEPLPQSQGPEFSKIIPLEQALSVYSETSGIPDLLSSFDSLDSKWDDLKDGAKGFFRGADIDPDEYFGSEKGSALVFHSFDVFDAKPYPQFSLLYRSKQNDTAIAKAIFKTGAETSESFGDASFTGLAAEGKNYDPAFYSGKANVVSSAKKELQSFISASQGNRPVIGDDLSYAALGEYAKAPHHLVMNIPLCIDAVRSFFLYGAKRNGGYSAVTIDRDIMPLAEPLSRYETLHIASGFGNRKTGRIVLTEKKQQ